MFNISTLHILLLLHLQWPAPLRSPHTDPRKPVVSHFIHSSLTSLPAERLSYSSETFNNSHTQSQSHTHMQKAIIKQELHPPLTLQHAQQPINTCPLLWLCEHVRMASNILFPLNNCWLLIIACLSACGLLCLFDGGTVCMCSCSWEWQLLCLAMEQWAINTNTHENIWINSL